MQQFGTVPAVEDGQELLREKMELREKHKSGANWFYWIAGLSVVNSIIMMAGGTWAFIIGLGITELADAISIAAQQDGSAAAASVGALAFFMSMGVVGLFVLFGVFAKKGHQWAFIVGMIVYALDGMLFLLISDFFSMAFHALALYYLFGGLKAMNRLAQLESQPVMRQPAPAWQEQQMQPN